MYINYSISSADPCIYNILINYCDIKLLLSKLLLLILLFFSTIYTSYLFIQFYRSKYLYNHENSIYYKRFLLITSLSYFIQFFSYLLPLITESNLFIFYFYPFQICLIDYPYFILTKLLLHIYFFYQKYPFKIFLILNFLMNFIFIIILTISLLFLLRIISKNLDFTSYLLRLSFFIFRSIYFFFIIFLLIKIFLFSHYIKELFDFKIIKKMYLLIIFMCFIYFYQFLGNISFPNIIFIWSSMNYFSRRTILTNYFGLNYFISNYLPSIFLYFIFQSMNINNKEYSDEDDSILKSPLL